MKRTIRTAAATFSRDRGQAQQPKPTTVDSNQIALYEVDRVRAALGVALHVPIEDLPRDTEHQERLATIVGTGEAGRWRDLQNPSPSSEETIANLFSRAPHFDELATLVTTRVRAANMIGLPMSLPPILIVGSFGIGKSWVLSRLGALLGLPFRRYTMSSASLNEGLDGAHPSWRNAQPGLLAKTLLAERIANPLLFVDEVDKGAANFHVGDPYRPFYAFLDPSDAREFTDEYLGFPIDASNVNWVMAANETSSIPAPILDRLTILVVPEPDEAHRAIVATSVYVEANSQHRYFFDADPSPAIIERLAGMSPRTMRRSLSEGMARAASDGRRKLKGEDIATPAQASRKTFGFSR